MTLPPKSPKRGILETRTTVQIGDTQKSGFLHILTSGYASGAKVFPDSSEPVYNKELEVHLRSTLEDIWTQVMRRQEV